MKNYPLLLILGMLFMAIPATAQVTNNIQTPTSINDDGAAPDASAILDVQSTEKGMLVPRMTYNQRNAINNPATGLLVFDTFSNSFWFYDGTEWNDLSTPDTGWIDYIDKMYTYKNIAINTLPTSSDKLLVYRDLWDVGEGYSTIKAIRQGVNAIDGGFNWESVGVDAAIHGVCYTGNNFSAGVYGSSSLQYQNSSAVIGTNGDASVYGALGHRDANYGLYAGYFNGDVKTEGNVIMNNGRASINWDGIDFNSQLYVLRESGDIGPVKSNIYARRMGSTTPSNGGIGWEKNNVDAALKGVSDWGNNYTAAVYGASDLDFTNSAAVWGGSSDASTFGALGYKDGNGFLHAGYINGNFKLKKNITIDGINIENDTNTNNWLININSADNDFEFHYNAALKAFVSDFDGAYTNTSDRNLKTDIEYLDGVLPKITQLKPAKYFYKNAADAPQKSHGFIAQEVQQIFPEIVRKKNGTLTLAYDDFAILSVQAIKEQQVIINAQQAELNNQQTEINQLKADFEALKAMVLEKE